MGRFIPKPAQPKRQPELEVRYIAILAAFVLQTRWTSYEKGGLRANQFFGLCKLFEVFYKDYYGQSERRGRTKIHNYAGLTSSCRKLVRMGLMLAFENPTTGVYRGKEVVTKNYVFRPTEAGIMFVLSRINVQELPTREVGTVKRTSMYVSHNTFNASRGLVDPQIFAHVVAQDEEELQFLLSQCRRYHIEHD